MKKKIVVSMSMNGLKGRGKAMQIIAGVTGVESVSYGKEGSTIEVKADERVDAADMINLLKNKLGKRICWLNRRSTVLVKLESVTPITEQSQSQSQTQANVQPNVIWSSGHGIPNTHVYEIRDYPYPITCFGW